MYKKQELKLTGSVVSDDWSSQNSSNALEWPIRDFTVSVAEKQWAPQNGRRGVHHIVVQSRVPVRNGGIALRLQSEKKGHEIPLYLTLSNE